MNIIKLTLTLCLLIALVAIEHNDANAQCSPKYSIDYVVTWSPSYNACNSEMKTTLQYLIEFPGAYKVLKAEVWNTPFLQEYWAAVICPHPPCSGSITEWTHCTTLEGHKMRMDIIPIIGDYIGFNEHVFTAEYFADDPD